ncbi:hypothetical protein KEJ15_09320 [Candidatus Bathyarchaeota archaeon]|nr:hypothetical protein [Candidatus Bathyarchaeota archaeon]
MKTESLEIDERFGQEYKGRYVFQEMTWAKRNRIIQKHTKYSKATGEVESSDFIAIQAETIWASLKEQPQTKPISLEKLLGEDIGVPVELGELFSKIANKLNGMSHEDLRFLLEQLDEESRIQLFKSFGFVKPSGGLQHSSQDSPQKPSSNSQSSSTS